MHVLSPVGYILGCIKVLVVEESKHTYSSFSGLLKFVMNLGEVIS